MRFASIWIANWVKSSVTRFSDGEIYFQILENVRGADVFIVQPTCPPVDSNLIELFLMIDAFKRASAKRITAVHSVLWLCAAGSQRQAAGSDFIQGCFRSAGRVRTDRLLTMDLHAPQIQGFFSIPVDHLFAAPVLVEYFQKLNLPNLTVVSPDAGGVERARAFAKRLNAELAMVNKRRIEANVAAGDECHRRCQRPDVSGRGRHDRHRRNAGENGRGAAEGTARQRFMHAALIRFFRDRRWNGSRIRISMKSS